jgi:hypothetical protein
LDQQEHTVEQKLAVGTNDGAGCCQVAPSQNVGASQSGEVEHMLSSRAFGKKSILMMETWALALSTKLSAQTVIRLLLCAIRLAYLEPDHKAAHPSPFL